MAAPSTQCQNSLLCQTSSDHQVLLRLPSKISPPVLLSLPISCSRQGSHISLAFQLWPCPLRSIIHTAAMPNTKLHCFKLPYHLHDKIQTFSMVYKTHHHLAPAYTCLASASLQVFRASVGPNSLQLQSCMSSAGNVTVRMLSHFLIHFLSSRGQFQLGLQDSAQMYLLCEAFPDPDTSKLN